MIEPVLRDVAVSLLSSGAYDVLKAEATRWISVRFAEHSDDVRAAAEANKDAFLVDLAGRVQRLESTATDDTSLAGRIIASLKDPDVAATVQSAVIAAARTSSRQRHSILADAIAARMVAPEGSARAVASSFAVEIVPRLATAHLDILGLLSVIYGPRRPEFDLPAEDHHADDELNTAAEAWADRYTDWLVKALEHYRSIALTEGAYAHLVAASCISFERKVSRDLEEAVLPRERIRNESPGYGLRVRRRLFHHDVTHFNGWLYEYWHLASLQYARPTPAGLLIGAAVHDAKTGSSTLATAEWGKSHELVNNVVKNDVWDGQTIGREFFDALRRQIRQDTGRGGSWP